jgi:aminopeptidase
MTCVEVGPVARDAARRVLQTALKLKSNDRIAVYFDESGEKVANFFGSAADEIGIQIHTCYVSVAEQKAHGLSHDGTDFDFLAGCKAVLICLTDDSECARFRHFLLGQCMTEDRKVGHMPGINERILVEALNIDYHRAEQICDDLTLILAVGESAVLETSAVTPAGDQMIGRLNLDLGGLSRPSIASSGVIPIGTWGNLPGGEAFIAPVESKASGAFVLTGSFENRVLRPQEFVVLHFSDGTLTSIEGPDDIKREFGELLDRWRLSDPLNYSNLAELGIGINEGIRSLSGRALIDEKCSDTIHIALGSNYGYGGTVDSNVHQDLVSWRPTLMVDNQPVLEMGKRIYDPARWRENIDDITPNIYPKAKTLIGRGASVRCEYTEDGRLKVRRAVSAARLCLYTIGDNQTSKELTLLYKLLPPAAFKIQFDELRNLAIERLGWSAAKIIRALSLLRKHGAITVS